MGRDAGRLESVGVLVGDAWMESAASGQWANWRPGATAEPEGVWLVSWLPGRALDRGQALVAMALAEAVAHLGPDAGPGSRMWPLVRGWAAELGIDPAHAVALLASAPG